MAGKAPIPQDIIVDRQAKFLELVYEQGRYQLPFEFLRVCSPSAEVQGHGPGQETLQTGKRDVLIDGVESVGHYAIKPIFSDGHDSGIYTWEYLYEMSLNYQVMWQNYLNQLEAAGVDRDAPMTQASGHSCGH